MTKEKDIKAATVGQLIEHLKTFDPNLPVCTQCFDSTYQVSVSPDCVVMGYVDTDMQYGMRVSEKIEGDYLQQPIPAVLIRTWD